MASNYWVGGAIAVAQVSTAQVTGYDVATTYKLTIGTVVISTIAAGSANATAAALVTAWNLSAHPFCAAVTASSSTDTVTLTADTAGIPFVVTSSVTGGAGTIGSVATGTANSGPNDFGTAFNWATGAVPASGDSIEFGNGDYDVLWGLDQSAKTFAVVTINEAFGLGKIGLDANKFQTSATAQDETTKEYRQAYLKAGGTAWSNRSKSGRILWDFSSIQTTASNTDSASASDDDPNMEPVRLIGTHASNALHVSGGVVGVARTQELYEVSTFATVTATSGGGGSFAAAGGSATVVNLGAACTLTSIAIAGAEVNNFGAAATTVNITEPNGTYTCYGAGAHTTINNRGTVNYRSSGTLGTYTGAGTFDTSADPRAKTISNMTIYSGADVNTNTGNPLSVTFTNGIDLAGCSLADVTLDVGPHVTVTPSAI